ncbi:hypothetical protein I7I48_10896 [Histoplasma ohiense]|nr:hypothetical protein I7I48_10896 [Histoplasma ohiense (nom. inval.)]
MPNSLFHLPRYCHCRYHVRAQRYLKVHLRKRTDTQCASGLADMVLWQLVSRGASGVGSELVFFLYGAGE